MYDSFMNTLFYWCVELLRTVAPYVGMTYEEINIWLFVVIHPAVTVLLFGMWYNARRNKQNVDAITYYKRYGSVQ